MFSRLIVITVMSMAADQTLSVSFDNRQMVSSRNGAESSLGCSRWCMGSDTFLERSCSQADCVGCSFCQKVVERQAQAKENATAVKTALKLERVNSSATKRQTGCMDACVPHATIWMVKCLWTSCSECAQCAYSDDKLLVLDVQNVRNDRLKEEQQSDDLLEEQSEEPDAQWQIGSQADSSGGSVAIERSRCGDACHDEDTLWTVKCLGEQCSSCSMCRQSQEFLVRADLQIKRVTDGLKVVDFKSKEAKATGVEPKDSVADPTAKDIIVDTDAASKAGTVDRAESKGETVSPQASAPSQISLAQVHPAKVRPVTMRPEKQDKLDPPKGFSFLELLLASNEFAPVYMGGENPGITSSNMANVVVKDKDRKESGTRPDRRFSSDELLASDAMAPVVMDFGSP